MARRRERPPVDEDDDIEGICLDADGADVECSAAVYASRKPDRKLLAFFRRWFAERGEVLA